MPGEPFVLGESKTTPEHRCLSHQGTHCSMAFWSAGSTKHPGRPGEKKPGAQLPSSHAFSRAARDSCLLWGDS
jgi:hypothetical protein